MNANRATPNKAADTSAQEAEIDRHVSAVYPPSLDELRRTRALTPAEIKIVEESNAPKTSVT